MFFQSLKEAADNYFNGKGLERTGDSRLYIKTAVLFLVALALYLLILFSSFTVWAIILFSCLLGFTLACIGFNVMHDANHGAYSSNHKANYAINANWISSLASCNLRVRMLGFVPQRNLHTLGT